MKAKEISYVPQQSKGAFHDTGSRAEVDAVLVDEQFEILKSRFLDINHWQEICTVGTTAFGLFSAEGTPLQRNPQVGDKIRIDVPGPDGSDAFDWVDVEDFREFGLPSEREYCMMMTLRPACPPGNSAAEPVAHFYSGEATSTIAIVKGENYLCASVHGRNEVPNTESPQIPDKLRNVLLASGGALGAAKVQWKMLTDGLLKDLGTDG